MSDLPVISPISPVTPAVLPLHHASTDTAAASPGLGGWEGRAKPEAAHGLFSSPVVDRRGGPMDMMDPSSGSETGFHQDRPPLRSQLSSKSGCSTSSQSQQSFVSAASSLSDQSPFSSNSNLHIQHTLPPTPPLSQPQQGHHPAHYPSHFSGPTISPTLTTAAGQLAPPPPEKSKSRRWSLTGRFFDKRKSITEPFHIPSSLSQPPLNIATSYNSSNNSNIVYGPNGGHQPKGERTSNGPSSPDSDSPTSPPNSNGGSRRSSIADIPKALFSSLRRVSLSGPPSMTGPVNSSSNSGAQASGLLSAGADETDRRRSDQSDSSEKASWLGEKPLITMAVPKAPPQKDPSVPPPKSILKKRPSDLNVNASGGSGMVTSAALAGIGGSKAANEADHAAGTATNDVRPVPPHGGPPRRLSALESEDIHPMATPDMDLDTIKLLTSSADHRARLVTNSPPPSRPHDTDHPVSPVAPAEVLAKLDGRALMGGAGSPPPGGKSNNNDDNSNNSSAGAEKTAGRPLQGAAIPPDFTPGMQSNLHKDRGGERPQGAVGPDEMSQDELLTHQMLTFSARAQGLAQQYYGSGSGGQGAIQGGLGGGHSLDVGGGHGGLMVPGSGSGSGSGGQQGGAKRRSINFLDRIEIIPAYRKADYNRSSDKHATFRILTPDLKSEIRDELNTYKMREMAVHVESMGNTAFH
ncbi:unnamed protein product [Mortierella alpina]